MSQQPNQHFLHCTILSQKPWEGNAAVAVAVDVMVVALVEQPVAAVRAKNKETLFYYNFRHFRFKNSLRLFPNAFLTQLHDEA
jgi:hypothetical protein